MSCTTNIKTSQPSFLNTKTKLPTYRQKISKWDTQNWLKYDISGMFANNNGRQLMYNNYIVHIFLLIYYRGRASIADIVYSPYFVGVSIVCRHFGGLCLTLVSLLAYTNSRYARGYIAEIGILPHSSNAWHAKIWKCTHSLTSKMAA